MASMYEFGIVGAGGRGRRHMKNIFELRDQEHFLYPASSVYEKFAAEKPSWVESVSNIDATVKAVFDPSQDARDQAVELCQESESAPATFDSFTEFREFGEYDAVVIASPNHVHIDAALPLIKDEVDIFCEKPVATTLPDYDRLIEADRESSSTFYVGFNLRSALEYRRMKDLIADGSLGKLGSISSRTVRTPFPDGGHYYSQAESGGALLEKNCHDFDLMNWFTESDPVKVSAFGGQHVLTENNDVNDHAIVNVEYANGVMASHDLTMYAPFPGTRNRNYEIRGSEGLIRTPDKEATFDLYQKDNHQRLNFAEYDYGHGGADIVHMKNFFGCLESNGEPPATLVDAKKAAAMAIGAETAINEKKNDIVHIDESYNLQ